MTSPAKTGRPGALGAGPAGRKHGNTNLIHILCSSRLLSPSMLITLKTSKGATMRKTGISWLLQAFGYVFCIIPGIIVSLTLSLV